MAQVCPGCQTELIAGARFCHQCGRRLRPDSSGRLARLLRLAMVAAAIDGIVAWLLLFVEVESVLVTGPILCVLGAILVLGSLPIRFRQGWILGAIHCGICGLLVILVNTLNWGPGHAKIPFINIGAIYLVGTLPLARFVYRSVPVEHDPNRCIKCGYLLYGLAEPRCPECGTVFDPTTVGSPSAGDPVAAK
jgi:hypothetical protein